MRTFIARNQICSPLNSYTAQDCSKQLCSSYFDYALDPLAVSISTNFGKQLLMPYFASWPHESSTAFDVDDGSLKLLPTLSSGSFSAFIGSDSSGLEKVDLKRVPVLTIE